MMNASNEVRCLEHQTLKVPYEILNKKFRTAQKNIDREVQRVQAATNELEKFLQKLSSISDLVQALDSFTDKLTLMKRKADESLQDETEVAKACKRRLDHLKECETLSGTALYQWQKKRLDRMLVEYFLRAGYYNAAIKLAKHSDIEDLTNISLFLTSREVELALERKDTSNCLAWCYENKSKLRKMKSTLEFNVRQQEFVELVRAGNRFEAVSHARKYFVSGEDIPYSDLQKCMGLLVFPLDTQVSPYKEMLDPSSWTRLIQDFRRENFKLYQMSQDPVFTVTLHAGLSALKTQMSQDPVFTVTLHAGLFALKTHHCYSQAEGARSTACPVCHKKLNNLARTLPFAHCAQSRLMCQLSGSPLNENNPPMMLPNGHVYGHNALMEMAALNDGEITCPRTKDLFNVKDIKKVFIM